MPGHSDDSSERMPHLKEKIDRLRAAVAWRIYPYASKDDVVDAHLDIVTELQGAKRDAGFAGEERERVDNIGQAYHNFREELGGDFAPLEPEHGYYDKLAAATFSTILGKHVINALKEHRDD